MLKEKIKDLAEIDVQPLRKQLIAKKQLPTLVQAHIAKPDINSLSINNTKRIVALYRNPYIKSIRAIHSKNLPKRVLSTAQRNKGYPCAGSYR